MTASYTHPIRLIYQVVSWGIAATVIVFQALLLISHIITVPAMLYPWSKKPEVKSSSLCVYHFCNSGWMPTHLLDTDTRFTHLHSLYVSKYHYFSDLQYAAVVIFQRHQHCSCIVIVSFGKNNACLSLVPLDWKVLVRQVFGNAYFSTSSVILTVLIAWATTDPLI